MTSQNVLVWCTWYKNRDEKLRHQRAPVKCFWVRWNISMEFINRVFRIKNPFEASQLGDKKLKSCQNLHWSKAFKSLELVGCDRIQFWSHQSQSPTTEPIFASFTCSHSSALIQRLCFKPNLLGLCIKLCNLSERGHVNRVQCDSSM